MEVDPESMGCDISLQGTEKNSTSLVNREIQNLNVMSQGALPLILAHFLKVA